MKPFVLTAAASAALTLCLAACGGGSTTPSASGSVMMGPVANASVAVHEIAADGTVSDKPVATATTTSDGSFSIRPALRYPVLLRVSGGTYEEEASGDSATLSSEIDAVYLTAPSHMVVSPYSNAIVADARAAGGLTAGNVAAAMSRVNAFAGDIDVQQTSPTVSTTAVSGTVPDGAKMALALGAESVSRTSAGLSVTDSTLTIVAQAANGDTLASCHQGAGDVDADGTLAAPVGTNCAITTAAATYAGSPRNRSGIASTAALAPVLPGATQTASANASTCGDRIALLRDNAALFAGRQKDVQARIGQQGVTAANWASVKTVSSWGPFAGQYGAIQPSASCSDIDAFRRELIMAAENYWVDQNINYCHHHSPGWTPPDDSADSNPKYRNSSNGSTSGVASTGTANPMTCTAQRNANGEQQVQRSSKVAAARYASADVQWHGVDCSDFTSWVYNFAGVTTGQTPLNTHVLETGIGSQACSTPASDGTTPKWAGPSQPGVLLDINNGNFDTTQPLLLAGDLLYITQQNKIAAGAKPANAVGTYEVSHVVTWTGKRYSDLIKGEDGWRYDWRHIGEAGSRLGGDFEAELGYPMSELDPAKGNDPWMIIDSHYAGPAYRPFVNWYRNRVSNVRRIIGADAARVDPSLAPYVIEQQSNAGGVIRFNSKHARDKQGAGATPYQMIFQEVKGVPTCYREGTAN